MLLAIRQTVSQFSYVKEKIMLNDNTSVETRRKLAEASDKPSEVLEELSKDSDHYLRALVASNLNTSTEVLLQLGIEFPDEVTNNPIFSLLMLENPDSKFIRLALARSSTTSIEILEKLAGDSDSDVRLYVAANTNTPPECLLFLVEDKENSSVSKQAVNNASLLLNSLEKLAKNSDFSIRAAVAKNANTPVDILIKLAADDDRFVRAVIADNSNTPVSILIKLAGDSVNLVRKSVAINVNTPVNI